MGDIILVTRPPRFWRVNGALHCELVSGSETHEFCISKQFTEIALRECAEVFADWNTDPVSISEFKQNPH
jgi:hypothetical protein